MRLTIYETDTTNVCNVFAVTWMGQKTRVENKLGGVLNA